MHWITANPKCDIGHNLHLTRSFAQQGQYCWKLYKLCALRRFVQAEVFRPECFSWSCLYIPADSHRLCSEWITLDIVAFTNLSASPVSKTMRDGTRGGVSRSGSSSCTCCRSHMPRDFEVRMDCGHLTDSPLCCFTSTHDFRNLSFEHCFNKLKQ